jgi:hypothetical protein
VSNGKGAGIRVGPARRFEAYHNTFYNIPNQAVRLGDDGHVGQATVINNIIAHAGTAIEASVATVPVLTSDRNLFWNAPLPSAWKYDPSSVIGSDPMFVDNPRSNDFFTKTGSPARDRALPEPRMVDLANQTYCGAGPDIGFLESCLS